MRNRLRPGAAQPPLPVLEQPQQKSDVTDLFVGDMVSRVLLKHVTDGDQGCRTQSGDGGDVRLLCTNPQIAGK